MSPEANADLIRRYIEAVWNEGHLDFINVVWDADRAVECREAWQSHRLIFAQGYFTIDDLIAHDDKVVLRWSFHGSRPGPARLNPTLVTCRGRTVAFSGISIWQVQNGRFVDSYFESEGPGIYE